MPIKWDQTFSVHNKTIDTHHKHIVHMVNTLEAALHRKTEQTVIPKILSELADYIQYHFSYEEQMFLVTKYPDKEEHLKQHTEFQRYLKRIQTNENAVTGEALLKFLTSWLLNHILQTDKRMVPFLKENKSI